MISNSLKMMVDRDVANIIDYSTSEQDTGRKWIDGKPIYQKSYLKSSVGEFTNELPSNVDTVINSEAILQYTASNNVKVITPIYMQTSGDYFNFVFVDSTLAIRNATTGMNNIKIAITIYYTKTTDTAAE